MCYRGMVGSDTTGLLLYGQQNSEGNKDVGRFLASGERLQWAAMSEAPGVKGQGCAGHLVGRPNLTSLVFMERVQAPSPRPRPGAPAQRSGY